MHAFLAKAVSCSHSTNPVGKTSCMKQKLGQHLTKTLKSHMAWCQTMLWPLIQISSLASWRPFESAKNTRSEQKPYSQRDEQKYLSLSWDNNSLHALLGCNMDSSITIALLKCFLNPFEKMLEISYRFWASFHSL
jgi:hypothetical protein